MKNVNPLLAVDISDESETHALAEDLAVILLPGDVVALSGTLGAGKTTFCRAVLRALAKDDELEVPSPTFTLVQPYALERLEVAHFDLYRLSDPDELIELGFDDQISDAVSLIEWPDKAGDFLPSDTLWVSIETGMEDGKRKFRFFGDAEKWRERITRSARIREFLNGNGWPSARRHFLQGDASYRQYEVISDGGRTAILMNAPERPLDPIVKDGRAYSEIANITRTVHPFIAIDIALAQAKLRVPALLGTDLDAGLLLLEHLGDQTIAKDGRPVAERYLAAIDILAFHHSRSWPDMLPMPDGTHYQVPSYDRDALMIEVEIFLDWYVAQERQEQIAHGPRRRFLGCWSTLIDILSGAERSLVLRDFHSPNLLWRPGEKGNDRIGLIDFQDAVIGPSAYDLGSLVYDARVTIEPNLRDELIARYCAVRELLGAAVDEEELRKSLAIAAAQRITKIAGLFIRLSNRDGKKQYLAHLPRVFDYLEHCLTHPVLSDLKACYEEEGWIDANRI
ncbi:MAG: tRNA (adenosine(37)-N6)-threonylcarbamoyltransferase complex ATPase subunit type 1 TsaE [Stappiaceae bacterium]